MEIKCESCGKITEDENSIFCKYCGFRYGRTELDVLKNIEIILQETQRKIERNSRTQTRISFASLIMSMAAFLIALGALLVFVFTQSNEQKFVGLGIIVIVLFSIWLIFKRTNVAPVDLDEIEK